MLESTEQRLRPSLSENDLRQSLLEIVDAIREHQAKVRWCEAACEGIIVALKEKQILPPDWCLPQLP